MHTAVLVIGALIGVWITWLVFMLTGRTDLSLGHGRRLYAGSVDDESRENVRCNLNPSDKVHECGGGMLEFSLAKDRATKIPLFRVQTITVGWLCPACGEFVLEEKPDQSDRQYEESRREAGKVLKKILAFFPKSESDEDKE